MYKRSGYTHGTVGEHVTHTDHMFSQRALDFHSGCNLLRTKYDTNTLLLSSFHVNYVQ